MTDHDQHRPDSGQDSNFYLSQLGLNSNPFEEPLQFLVDADEEIVERIVHVLEGADKAVLLAARADVDRRRMLEKVLLRMPTVTVCRVTASLMMTEQELLGILVGAERLTVAEQDQINLEKHLVTLLASSTGESAGLLCVIEDAQLVSEALMDYLLALVHDYKLQLVLLSSNPEIFSRVTDLDLFRWQIDAYSPVTIRRYLDARFHRANISTPEVFSDKVVAWICTESRGEQHLIDQKALQVLQHTRIKTAPMNLSDFWCWVLVICVGLLLFPGAYLISRMAEPASGAVSGSVPSPTLVEAPAKIAPDLPFKTVRVAGEPTDVKENPELPVVMKSAAPEPAKPVTKPARSYADAEALRLPVHVTIKWLKQVNPEFYTIQVIASHSREKIDRFMETAKSTPGYAWFESSYNAQPWYVVIKGIYRDREAALGDAEEVSKITGLQPWVRSFANISERLKSA